MSVVNPVLPISVIIPCYRSADTILRAFQSILDQTQQPSEVILIDDASGDGTLSILNQLEVDYAGWVKVLALAENNGASEARNAGWDVASQPYIAFLDADDSWHPEKLANQYQIMLDHPEFVVSGHRCVRYSEMLAKPVSITKIRRVTSLALLFKNQFNTPTVMLKTALVFRFKAGKHFAEDFYLWQQIAFSGAAIAFIDCTLAYVYKPLYGASGLSAHLWAMEKAELDNFYCLYKARHINAILFLMAGLFSLLKYGKRLVISAIQSSEVTS